MIIMVEMVDVDDELENEVQFERYEVLVIHDIIDE